MPRIAAARREIANRLHNSGSLVPNSEGTLALGRGDTISLKTVVAAAGAVLMALEILGSHAQLTNGGSESDGYWQYQQLRSRGNTIEAGSSEVLRNIVAERVLGLPRSR